MKVIEPVSLVDGMLTAASVPETDHAAWSAGTSYAKGARVLRAGYHVIFESLVAANLANDPGISPNQWEPIGATNRWRMFDEAVGSTTDAVGSIEVTLEPGSLVEALGVLDTNSATVRVVVSIGGFDVYDVTQAGAGTVESPASLVFLGLPVDAAAEITVTAEAEGPSDPISIGTLIFGALVDLGITESGPTAGINDFSRRTTDEFGVTTIVTRGWAKRMTVRSLLATADVDDIQRRLAALRATASLWIGDEDYSALTIYGYFKDFSIDLALDTISYCSLSIEGLTTGQEFVDLQSPLNAFLTNEGHIVPANSSGVVTSYSGASGSFRIYSGVEDVSSLFSLTTQANPQGLTVSYVGQTYSVTAGLDAGEPTASLLIRATGSGPFAGLEVDKQFSLTKSTGGGTGLDAKTLTVISDRQTIAYDSAGSPSPSTQTTNFATNKQNTSATVAWSITDAAGVARTPVSTYLSAATGDSVTMTEPQFDAARNGTSGVIVTATLTDGATLVDRISVVRVRAGAPGATGASAIAAYLTNETHTLPADGAGNVLSYAGATGDFVIFAGATDVSASFALSTASNAQSLTIGYSGKTYSVTAGLDIGEPAATVVIRATGSGAFSGVTIDKLFSLAKSSAGADGAPAKMMSVLSDRQTIAYDAAGVASPTTQTTTFATNKQNTSATVNWTITDAAGVARTPVTTYLSAGTGDSVTMTEAQFDAARNGTSGVIVTATLVDGSTLTDRISVVRVRAGATGAPGASAKTLKVISNRQIIAYDATGSASPTTQTTTFSTNKQNTSATVTWSVTDATGAARTPVTDYLSAATGDSVTMTETQFAAARNGTSGVIVTASLTDGATLTDQASLMRVQDGTLGADPGVVISMTRASVTVFAYADGSVVSWVPAQGDLQVFDGGVDVTASATLSATPDAGMSGSINSAGHYAVTAMSGASGALKLSVVYDGTTHLRDFFVSKVNIGYEIVATLPATTLFEGRIVYLTSDGKLYRYHSGAWTAAVPALDIAGTLSDAQLAGIAASKVTGTLSDAQLAAIAAAKITGQLVAAQIADAAITTAKFAAGIEPVVLWSGGSLPTTPQGYALHWTVTEKLYHWNGSSYTASVAAADIAGTLSDAQLAGIAASKVTGTLSDAQLAAIAAAKITGQLVAAQIADAAITTAKFAAGIEPVVLWSGGSLPTTPQGYALHWTVTEKLYRWNGSSYTASVPATDVTGQLSDSQIAAIAAAKLTGQIVSTQISDGAISTPKLAAGAVTASQIAADTITAAQIAAGAITATELAAGSVTAGKVAAGSISATEIAADTITAAQIAAGAISASELAAGSVTASKMVLTDLENLCVNGDFSSGLDFWDKRIVASGGSHVLVYSNASPGWPSSNALHFQRGIAGSTSELTATNGSTSFSTDTALVGGFPVQPGDDFLFEAMVYCTSGARPAAEIAVRDLSGALNGWAFTWSEYPTANENIFRLIGTVKNLSGAAGKAWLRLHSQGTTTASNAELYFWNIRLKRRAAASLIVDGSISTNKIAAGAVTANEIAAYTITAAQIAAGAITATALAAGSVTAGKIAAGTIQALDIAAGTITGDRIAANTITGSKIAADTITAGQIAAGAISTSELAAGAVTASKMLITAPSMFPDGQISDVAWWTSSAGSVTGAGYINPPGAWYLDDNPAVLDLKGGLNAWVTNGPLLAGSTTNNFQIVPPAISGVKPGEYYEFSATLFNNSNRPNLQMVVQWFDPSGTYISGASVNCPNDGVTRKMAFQALAPAGASAYRLYWDLNGATTPYAGTGIVSSISVRQCAGGTLLIDGSVSAIKIAANTITAAQIAADTITAAQIATGAITATELGAGAVTAGKIAAGAIQAVDIAAGAIVAGKVAANAITATELAADAVTANKIMAGAVTAGKVAAGAITALEISVNTITADRFLTNAGVDLAAIVPGSINTAVAGVQVGSAVLNAGTSVIGLASTAPLASGPDDFVYLTFRFTVTGASGFAGTVYFQRFVNGVYTGTVGALSGIFVSVNDVYKFTYEDLDHGAGNVSYAMTAVHTTGAATFSSSRIDFRRFAVK